MADSSCCGLGFDSGVPWHIVFITRLESFLAFLTAIAAVVTPLGLYQTVVEDAEWEENATFHYIEDHSDFGLARPQADLPWSRICGELGSVKCPNSFNNVSTFSDETGVYHKVHYYDTRVPQFVIEAFKAA